MAVTVVGGEAEGEAESSKVRDQDQSHLGSVSDSNSAGENSISKEKPFPLDKCYIPRPAVSRTARPPHPVRGQDCPRWYAGGV